MKETTKAMRRRFREHAEGGFPWRDILRGDIIDVGSGDDPLKQGMSLNLPDGGGDKLTDFFPASRFDVIHGSQVLEHAISPEDMLRSWITCLRKGGYIIVTVPDFELYEKGRWPSKFNGAHQTCWTMNNDLIGRTLIHLPQWLDQFSEVSLVMCRLIDTNYDYSIGPDIDQTLDPAKGVECFIEFVLKK